MTRMNMLYVGKITKYCLILFKSEVITIKLFDPMTGKKVIKWQIWKKIFSVKEHLQNSALHFIDKREL